MDTRRLQFLLELSRLGSMRNVADLLGTSTSHVSQQIAALARDTGVALVEPEGRLVRLTPAGRRLAEHAVTVLAAVEAARLDLDPSAEPAGTVRVCGFASAIGRAVLPVVADLATSNPDVRLHVLEHEPAEALDLLSSDDVDLALTYDYTLSPAAFDSTLDVLPLWSTAWGLGVPAGSEPVSCPDALSVFEAYRDHDWIGNSRNRADEDVVRIIASMAGFEPEVTHQSDSLGLVEEMIVSGLGVGLLPADRSTRPGVVVLPLTDPDVELRAYALCRRGRAAWPPLALVLDRLLT